MPEAAECEANRPGAPTVRAAIQRARRLLEAAGKEEAALDARLIVGLACGLSPEATIALGERHLHAEEEAAIDRLVARRLSGVPVSRLRGWREFWGLRFEISGDTLDPRPETEIVVEAALAALPPPSAAYHPLIVDLGTGSGCILLAMLSERPDAWGIGLDLNLRALEMARKNAASLGLQNRALFLCADWTNSLAASVADSVVCNPPYIANHDVDGLHAEVRDFDPRSALQGGHDGLECYRAIMPDLARIMKPGAVATFEVGHGQANQVLDLMLQYGFEAKDAGAPHHFDLGGLERVVAGVRQSHGQRPRGEKRVGIFCGFGYVREQR